MNKNSLKQMIVAEMIYADARKLMNESHKKRSLFEMMDDDYLDELDDRKFVHSMKMMLEDGSSDWDIANSDKPASVVKPEPAVEPEPVAAPNTDMIDDAPESSDLPLSSVGGEPAVFVPDSLGTSTDDGKVVSSPETSDIAGSTAPADGTLSPHADDLRGSVIDIDDWVDNPTDTDGPGDDANPGENNDSTIITIDGTRYYDGLKYLNNFKDEVPTATAESRLSLVDALYA